MKLAEDGRCDSPGISAKFCTYSMMDIDNNTIIHVETVDKHEVSLYSPNVEREAIDHAIAFLQGNDVVIDEITIDASSSVRKLIGIIIPPF